MNRLERQILDLLRGSLLGVPVRLDADFDWSAACQLAADHQVLPMLYHGAVRTKQIIPDTISEKLTRTAMRAAFVDQNQLYEIEQIRRCFLENGVDFMLLKGVWLKPLYPQSDLRPMGDVDILIKNEQYDTIRPLMLQMGYREILESDHELIWDKPGVLHVELHKRLIPSYNKDYYAYFGDGWRLAQPTAGSEHGMRAEDQFVYLFTHYAKHYRDAGIGIRHLMDLHVFLKAKPDLDWHYIEDELEKLQLLTFCRHSLETLAVWFDGKADTEMSDFMTDRIFRSGSYGTRQNAVRSEGVKNTQTATAEQVQKRKLLRLIFPSAAALANNYPILKKAPALLPFVWVYRWVAAIVAKRDTIQQQWNNVEAMNTDNIAAYKQELNYVGLDFHFEE